MKLIIIIKMYIQNIYINNFGTFRDFKMKLHNDTIIVGRSGVSKTYLKI